MIKAGDVLKFAEPLCDWHADFLDKGGKYILKQQHQLEFYQTEDEVWHVRKLEELRPMHIFLVGRNYSIDCGEFADFEDKNFEIVGREMK